MEEIAIIIPSRLAATRLPGKPLKIIDSKEMILHVCEKARIAELGEVYVATPDKEIFELTNKHGFRSFMTGRNHKTGTDRIFEVFEKKLNKKPNIIVNLQGDMPNIDPQAIKRLIKIMTEQKSEMATLASLLKKNELEDKNIVKVLTDKNIENFNFSLAKDFFRDREQSSYENIYHHIGIYAFTNQALVRYVNLKRTELELERNLEQMRALENNMQIHVGYVSSNPLSIDTEEDLSEIRELMEKK